MHNFWDTSLKITIDLHQVPYPQNGSHLMTADKTQVSQLLPFLVTTPVVVSTPQQKHALVSSKQLAKLNIFNGLLYP